MRLDFKSLAFGYSIISGAATPAWETALGQGKGYKINNKTTINELVKGLIYKAVPPKSISFKKGKGGAFVNGDEDRAGLVISAVFDKVFINETEIEGGKFILLIVKDDAESHRGRLKLKYGPDNKYQDGGTTVKNSDFIALVQSKFGLSSSACWFVTDISVIEQDKLILRTTIINKDTSEEYADNNALHAAWDKYYDEADELEDGKVMTKPVTTSAEDKIGENIILYGVPGCGKSHTIRRDYCDNENFMERVVFHPDYTYSDFVGQILPENIGGHISYPFVPGPFTRILKKAVDDPESAYFLIIEELNRGNAPAIFGEIFQLLDRIDGVSEYGINNADIANAVYGDSNHPIKLPKNLFLLATMNTADQNVFTLDTAFKRRWRMRSITNDISKCIFKSTAICGTNVTWESFLTTINEKVIELGEGNIGSEDKRLGAYFMLGSELKDIDLFSEKILMYLWNDAFKYDHDKVFKAEYKTLEQLIDGFKSKKFDIFTDSLIFKTIESPSTFEELEDDDETEDLSEITPEKYLEGKSGESRSLFDSILNELNDIGIDYSLGAVKNYISLKSPTGKIAAEFHLQKSGIKLIIKEPTHPEYLIGKKLPDSYRWSKDYEIIVNAEIDISIVASAIVDSYDQVNG